MRVLIVRAFPSIVDLRKNCYNHQEIGLATAFLSLGHEAGIVYYGGNNSRDMKYATSNGEIKIYYRKAKVLLERIAFFEDFSDLKEQYDLIISNECDQIETVKTLNRYAEKTVIHRSTNDITLLIESLIFSLQSRCKRKIRALLPKAGLQRHI